jgi:hypothetical protein
MLTHHFAVDITSVFGRENMPRLDTDFDRLTKKQLQVFGLSETMLSGASGGQTYAADALNRDVVSNLMTGYQKRLKKFCQHRALVVAEAQEHYDYEKRGDQRFPVLEEEVLEVDEETGKERIVQQPKLLIPEMRIRNATLQDEETQRAFLEALRAAGIPISMETRLTNVPVDLEDEVERAAEEQISQAVKAQEVRKETYLRLRDAGLPIDPQLETDFGAKVLISVQPALPGMVDEFGEVLPSVGNSAPGSTAPLAPTVLDRPIESGEGVPVVPGQTAGPAAASVAGPDAKVLKLPRNRIRPPESDEQRAKMPKARKGSLNGDGSDDEADDGYDESPLIDGPSHVGMRRHANLDPDRPLDEQVQ